MPLLEAQQDADPSTASIRQPGSDLQQLPTAATASPSSAIQAAPVKVLNKHLQASSAKGSSLHDVPVNSTAHAAVITRSHNSLSSSGNAPQQTSPESDADGTDSQEGVTQDSTDLYNTVEQLRQDLAAVQQRLHASDAECTHLQAMLTAHDEATETSAQTHAKLEQHWRSQSQQHQQQLKQLQQQLAQQQEQSAQQATSSTGFRQELQSSQQQVQSLQSQLAEQQNQLELAESAVKDLELQLHASQAQCDNAVAELGRFQRDMHTMKQQLAEQQQAQDNSQRMQQSMQAELNQSQAERDLLQQQLSTAQQQAAASEQSLHDRDTAWQEELQQQQSHKDKVQQV